MTKTMLFYDKIIPLSREEHKNLKFNPSGTMAYAANTHYTPLAPSEIPVASLFYPIFFMGSEEQAKNGTLHLSALLGIRPGENDFITEDGLWDSNCYLPYFVKRYPFIVGRTEGQTEFTFCIDIKSPRLSKDYGIPLFNEDGKNSDFLQERIGFLNYLNDQEKLTHAYVNMLTSHNLLKQQTFTIENAQKQRAVLRDFWTIDQEKLQNLSAKALKELHTAGFLAFIFAQINSIYNLEPLFARHWKKAAQVSTSTLPN